MKQEKSKSALPMMAAPYEPPLDSGIRPEMPPVNWFAPLTWLGKGFQDMRSHPWIAAFYGISFMLMAQVLGYVSRRAPEYMLTMISGCLLLGPFMAMGLYEVSRHKEQGEACEWSDSLTCWDSHIRSMAMLFWGFLNSLLIALALWPVALGLLLIGPWLGHASWHVYRECVRWPEGSAKLIQSSPI